MANRDVSITLGAVDASQPAFSSYRKNLQQLDKLIIDLQGSIKSMGTTDWVRALVKDVSPARSTIAGLREELARVTKELESIPVGSSKFAAYSSLVTHLKSELSDATSSANALGSGVAQMNSGLSSSGALAMNIGRVISDMPYGIIGVANNLDMLAMSFVAAKNEAALAGTSVSSMLMGALSGPSGIAMVGIPIVSTLAVTFGDDLMNAIGSSSDALDGLKQNLKGLEQYQDFDLAVQISGLDGIAKLKAELSMLLRQKARLEGKMAKENELAALGSEPFAFASYLTPGGAVRQMSRQRKIDEINARYSKQDQRDAASVFFGTSTFGEEENRRLLQSFKGAGMPLTSGQIETIIANNAKQWEIEQNKSETSAESGQSSRSRSRSRSGVGRSASESDKLKERVSALRQSLMTERELEDQRYTQGAEAIAAYYIKNGELTAEGNELAVRLAEDHQKKMDEIAGIAKWDADLEAKQERIATEYEIEQDRYDAQIEQLQEFLEAKAITEEAYQKRREEAAQVHSDIIKKIDASENIAKLAAAQSFFTMLASMQASKSKALIVVQKAAAIISATISAKETVVDAFKWGTKIGGPPLGFAFAATAAAAQAANIAAIASAGSGASGGTVMSSGTSTTTSSDGTTTSEMTTSNKTVTIYGLDKDSLYTGEQVAKVLNEFLADGGKLNIK